MTTVVQARCPGCRQTLRIPADWLSQAMRCRHCQMILQARTAAPAARETQGAPSPRSSRTQPQPAQAVTSAPMATRPAPVAVAAPVASNPFLSLEPAEAPTEAPYRRRRRSSSWWKGPVLALAVVVVACTVTILCWPHLKPLLLPPDDEVASAKQEEDRGPAARAPHGRPTVSKPPVKEQGKPGPDKVNKPVKPFDPSKPANPGNPNRPDPDSTPRPTRGPAKVMPRRALVVSVHDYLYANPVHDSMQGVPSSITINRMAEALADTTLHIPLTQVTHLSDDAEHNLARAPLKGVIEKTITSFLDQSREQDRVMVFFIGHSVELDNKAFLVPIEGEMDSPDTLIPLQWVLDQMAACKARQKVLVLDVNRFNPTLGQERPGAGPMGPVLDTACQKPPAGVQVWSSCQLKQRSYETDEAPEGVFVEAIYRVLRKGLQGKIQQPDDLIPLEQIVPLVNAELKKDLTPHKLEQVSRLSGTAPETGASFDKSQPAPPEARLALAPVPGNTEESKRLIEMVLDQIGTPPVKPTRDDVVLHYDDLPPFAPEALKKLEADKPRPDSKLRAAVKQARVALWAIAPVSPPKDLVAEVDKIKTGLRGVNLGILRDGYRAPAAANNGEVRFKNEVEKDEKGVARIIRVLDDALEMMEADEVKAERGKESEYWQANYDFMHARLQEQIAFLFEYQSLLGQMRKEFPPRDPAVHTGWRLASATTLQGDSRGKKLAREARKVLEKVAKSTSGTPWAVLSKREKLTALGLEWQASSNQ